VYRRKEKVTVENHSALYQTEGELMAFTAKQKRAVMREMAAKGGANSRKNLPDGKATDLGRRAVAARWARYRKENGLPAKPGDEKFL